MFFTWLLEGVACFCQACETALAINVVPVNTFCTLIKTNTGSVKYGGETSNLKQEVTKRKPKTTTPGISHKLSKLDILLVKENKMQSFLISC